MKFKLISFVVLIVSFQQLWSEPLLVVVLMVKNEACVIEATLQPFVEGGVTDFVIFDTGSTDGTQEIATNFLNRHNLEHIHIIEEPFIDFATSRNHALNAAESLFPQATFMLMPDAEWYMHNVEGLLQFCTDHQNDYHESYLVSIRGHALAFYTPRLIRCHKGIRFVGLVHEVLNQVTYATLPDDIYFEWRSSKKGTEKSAQRWLRDRDLLLKSYAENPHDPRTLFYLAQTYECLGDWHNAYIYYAKRVAMSGWDEEDFVTLYRLGRVAQMLELNVQDTKISLAVMHYLAAFSMRPHRAEPLINLAQYYISKGDMHLGFLFAQRAVTIPYPSKDILLIEKYLYDFVRYDVLGICAWYVGEYDSGEWAVRKALEVHPDAEHLQRNLKFYIDRDEALKTSSSLQDETQSIFTTIYKNNAWGDPESRAGSGSSLHQTGVVRALLPALLQYLNIKTFLDAPCGDCNWIRQTDLSDLQSYIGADIVEDIINNNCDQNYTFASSVTFIQKNIISDVIPEVDLIFCRDCFPHLTFEQTKQAIKNFKQSGSKYLLTTTYVKNEINYPIHTGYWMPLNLEKSPFNFPKPLMIIDEKATDWCNEKFGKSLGLWRLEDIMVE